MPWIALTRFFPTSHPMPLPNTSFPQQDGPHGHGTILLVGHQPTLGEAAALALSGRVLEWPIRKGAIWWLSAQGGTTTLRAVIDTKLMDGEP